LDANSFSALSEGKFWSDAVAFVQEKQGAQTFTFWQIVIFAWLCNGAMHFGMADLSIFRFARDKSSGWAPAIGMFLGHYVAWLCAALLLAAQIKLSQDATANPGALAWSAIGWTGIVCVVIAGWTTANPTIYRAGFAFQGVIPGSRRLYMTLLGRPRCDGRWRFPEPLRPTPRLRRYGGTVLGPMGAVIFVDFWLMKRFGLRDEYASVTNSHFNPTVLIAWILPVVVGLYLIFWQGVFAAYLVIPCWLASGILFLILNKIAQKKS
jgi:purine-cytosine permease-like protein